jgi:lipoate-protein ligase B
LQIVDWGLLDYRQAFERQAELVRLHLAGCGIDTLILVEHPATVTLGRRGSEADLRLDAAEFSYQGISLQSIDRGGLATAHEPGQLVVYPVLALKRKDVRWFARTFLGAVVDLLEDYGLNGYLKDGEPGVWVDDRKICSFGIALKKWVSSHGIALNVNNTLKVFETIIPCGRPQEIVTSMALEIGTQLPMPEVRQRFVAHFAQAFDYRPQGW